MVDIARPEYGQGWASQGERVVPADDKMVLGWVQEMMPFQWENYLQGRQDDALLYLLQKGVPEYSPTQEYIANKSIVQYQTNLYLAIATVTNVLPTVTASWKRLSPTLATNGTVPITGGGTGGTTAAEARANLGLGDASTITLPAAVGVIVKNAANTLVSRTIVGVAGDVTVTNPDGVAGNITVGVGSNVAKTNQDSSWTSKGGITLPKGSSSERGVEVPGKIRYNTELQKFEGFDGTSWSALGATSEIEITTLSGDGVTTSFTLNAPAFSESSVDVYIGGIWQNKGTYTVNGSTLSFSEAPLYGVDNIQVVSCRVVDLGIARASQVSIEDTTNLYTSTTVEGALREVGGRAKFIKNAILSYPDYAAASVAAATLPDGQSVDVEATHLRYTVSSGELTNERPVTEMRPDGGVSRTVEAALKDAASIKGFGAKGDDAADDAQAFQAADASPYDTIYVPEGIYQVGAYVPTKKYFGPGKLRISGGGLRPFDSIPNVLNYLAPNTVAGAGASRLGSFNTLFGYNVGGNFGPDAKRNTLFGHNLGSGDTIYPEENAPFNGVDNNGYGYHTLKKLQTGNSNNAYGGDALNELKTGSHNNAYGQAAGQQIVTQSDGCYFGSSAGGRADSGNGHAAYFGRDSARENRNTSNNTVNGWGAGRGVTPTPSTYTGDGTTSIFNVPGYVFTGTKQVRIDIDGVNILPANYSVTGIDGQVTLSSPPANGASIVLTPTIGSSNWSESTILGARALFRYRTGVRMTVSGYAACENIDSGNNSVVIGDEAVFTATSIDGSIIIGPRAYRSVAGAIANKLIIANQSSTPFIDGNMVGAGDANNFLTLDANIRTASDNNRTNGTASRRWSTVFAGTGTINTSDEREKEAWRIQSESEKAAALEIKQWIKAFKFTHGTSGRWHFGVGAQTVGNIMRSHGLNPSEYAFWCFNEWEEQPEIKDVDGNITQEYVQAGDRYGIRYDELAMFILSAL